jgi:hypothetical protein
LNKYLSSKSVMAHPTSLSAGVGVPILDQEIVTSTLVSPPHVLHTSGDVAASAEEYVPAEQPTQLAEPSPAYVPAKQSLQLDDPAIALNPAGQSVHDAAPLAEYSPSEHPMHPSAPLAE